EKKLQGVAHVPIVVDDENAHPGERVGLGPLAGRGRLGPPGRLFAQRQLDRERAALFLTRAFRTDEAAMELDQMLDDRQSDPETPGATGARALPAKALEDVREKLATAPPASVDHPNPGISAGALEMNRDVAAVRRELDRVGEERRDHLFE